MEGRANGPRLQLPCTLDWEEVCALEKRFPLFDFGVHTTNHFDLTRQSRAVVREELEQCIADFEREMARRPEHFAYPYNRQNAGTRQEVSHLRFRSAVALGAEDVAASRGFSGGSLFSQFF